MIARIAEEQKWRREKRKEKKLMKRIKRTGDEKNYKKTRIKKKEKKGERRVEPVSGGFVSNRLQSDKPLHLGPSLSAAVQHFTILCCVRLC